MSRTLRGIIERFANIVETINGLAGGITLVAGANVTITPSGQNITISATGSGGGGSISQATFNIIG